MLVSAFLFRILLDEYKFLYTFKNVHQTRIKIGLEMKNALTVQIIRKVPLERVDVRVTITIIAFKDIITHNHVTVSM